MTALSYLHVLSPLHTGTGQGTGVIDLPIARETTTNWPEIPGSSLKGALRNAARDVLNAQVIKDVFGPDISKGEDPAESSGKVWFAGARILCFPVRSFAGTFAYVTCPLALMAWQRDLKTLELGGLALPFTAPAANAAHTTTDTPLSTGNKVFLEDIDLVNASSDQTRELAASLAHSLFADESWQDFFIDRFAIVDDEVFTYLVTMATTITTRIRLESDTKTVADGAMWYEETIPPETIFWHPIVDHRQEFSAELASLFKNPFQLGGNATVGQGLVQGHLVPAGGKQQ